jgi:hypothetical protein
MWLGRFRCCGLGPLGRLALPLLLLPFSIDIVVFVCWILL